jgi:hypothetical protein
MTIQKEFYVKKLILALSIVSSLGSVAGAAERTCTDVANEVETVAAPAIIGLFHDKRLPNNKGNKELQALLESKIQALQKLAQEPCTPGALDI